MSLVSILETTLAKEINDSDILEYFNDILVDFDGTKEELMDIISPYVSLDFDIDAVVDQIYFFFNPDGDKNETLSLLSNPVNLKEVADSIQKDVNRSTSMMMKSSDVKTFNTDHEEAQVVNFKKKNKKKKENVVKQEPSDFYRSKGSTTIENIVVNNIDLFVGGEQLLENGLLNLVHGRKYGLIGRNGVGKTSLLRHISSGYADMPDISILHVEQEVVGDETLAIQSVLDADRERTELINEEKRILAIPSPTPENDAQLTKVYEQLTAMDADGAESTARTILSGLGFSVDMQSMPTSDFSGGWRMRIALARALFCQPDLLLLDEPTNMLDIQALIWLEEYLREIWTGTLLIVSHDRDFLNMVVTDIIHFQARSLAYYTGDYDNFEQQRSEKLLNQQRAYESHIAQKEHIEKFVTRFRANANRAALVQSRIKKLEKMTPISAVIEDPSLAFSFPETVALDGPVISVQNASFGYTPEKMIFNNLNFEITCESRIALVGSNGAGKSTLIKLLSKEVRPTDGYIIVNGGLNFAKFTQHHIDQMDLDMSPLQHLQSSFPGKTSLECRSMLGRYGLSGDIVFQTNDTLSGGQKSRLMFAHLGMSRPQLMFLDEPTNHLDIDTVDILAQALNEYEGAVILVSHDERLLSLVCNELWIVKDQSVNIFYGEFADYKRMILKEVMLN